MSSTCDRSAQRKVNHALGQRFLQRRVGCRGHMSHGAGAFNCGRRGNRRGGNIGGSGANRLRWGRRSQRRWRRRGVLHTEWRGGPVCARRGFDRVRGGRNRSRVGATRGGALQGLLQDLVAVRSQVVRRGPRGERRKGRSLGSQTDSGQEQGKNCRFGGHLPVEVTILPLGVGELVAGVVFLGGLF